MKKILLQIKDNKLYFLLKKRLNTEQKNLINTNVISQNELVFSDEYILQNKNIVHHFINELIEDYNINIIVIKEFEIASLILQVTTNINKINTLYLLEESILTYKIASLIINSNNIKNVYLYNIPSYLLEMLDKKNIKVDSKNEMLFLSDFMKKNELETFSSLYYKTTINLDFPLSKDDEEDFISFININKYLKNIYVNKLNKADIEYILEILYMKRLKNINIFIEQNINDIEIIEYLKKINKRNIKINGIQFKIDYSKEYLENNIMNQIHINAIKVCIIISLMIVSSVVFYVFFTNYVAMQKVESIQNDINNVIAEYRENTDKYEEEIKKHENELNESYSNENNNIDENIQADNDDIVIDNNPITNNDELKIDGDLAALLLINEDTVGWLKVNNTKVDYPVVQAKDNDYYLKRNFKKEKDKNGWVFMDYRANPVNLSQNTIIFGHNMYYSGVMFGTLYKTKNSDWYTKPENQIIEFNTLYKKMKWKIFSIYVVEPTNDYLITDFSTSEKFQEFLNKIIERSKYNFNTPVSADDKIITLSTCSDNGKKRLVIHAVLLDEKRI